MFSILEITLNALNFRGSTTSSLNMSSKTSNELSV